jgi:hypothetical protein|nr:MAG TPA: hypothetical protein [Caudoviricetes sp.]
MWNDVLSLNTIVGMAAAAIAVLLGASIKEIGYRVYILVLISAVLSTAAVIETWMENSTIMKSATVGWVIGYISDDVLLTINALLPDFVKDLVDTVTNGIKRKLSKWFGVDENDKDGYN